MWERYQEKSRAAFVRSRPMAVVGHVRLRSTDRKERGFSVVRAVEDRSAGVSPGMGVSSIGAVERDEIG